MCRTESGNPLSVEVGVADNAGGDRDINLDGAVAPCDHVTIAHPAEFGEQNGRTMPELAHGPECAIIGQGALMDAKQQADRERTEESEQRDGDEHFEQADPSGLADQARGHGHGKPCCHVSGAAGRDRAASGECCSVAERSRSRLPPKSCSVHCVRTRVCGSFPPGDCAAGEPQRRLRARSGNRPCGDRELRGLHRLGHGSCGRADHETGDGDQQGGNDAFDQQSAVASASRRTLKAARGSMRDALRNAGRGAARCDHADTIDVSAETASPFYCTAGISVVGVTTPGV